MNDSLASTLVLCDLDNLLLGEDGNLTQVVRDVLQLFSSRGGRLTVFSQRSPRAVRSILGSVRLAAPALVCGGTMAYHYADGNRVPLCSFAQQQELFTCLPDTPGVGVAVQMQDGTTRVLRMSNALERHLRQEWTPGIVLPCWASVSPRTLLSLPPSASPAGKCWTPSAPWRRWARSRSLRWRAVSPCWNWCRLWSIAQWQPMPRQSCALPPSRSP